MEVSDELIQKLKTALENNHKREFAWEAATNTAQTLAWLAQASIEIAMEEARRQKMLKESPKGFHLDKTGYRCLIA